MKIKRWLALALTAVMAVGVLTACGGGGGGGVSGSISNNGVQTQLKAAGVDVNLELLTKYTKAISYGIIEKKARKGGQNAAQNPHGDHRRSHAARPLFEEVGESA